MRRSLPPTGKNATGTLLTRVPATLTIGGGKHFEPFLRRLLMTMAATMSGRRTEPTVVTGLTPVGRDVALTDYAWVLNSFYSHRFVVSENVARAADRPDAALR